MPKTDDKRTRRRRAASQIQHDAAAEPGADDAATLTEHVESTEADPAKGQPFNGKENEPSISAMPPAPLPPGVLADPLDLPQLVPEMFINRELSWLDFNARVLFEAEDPTNPLLERVKFAAIFASNLDEFFMIRVAGVRRKMANGITAPGPDGLTPTEQLRAVRLKTQSLLERLARIVTRELVPALSAAGIEIVSYDELTPRQRDNVARQFEHEIFPILTPQAIDRGRRFPHVSNKSLNLIVLLRLGENERYARVKIPATLPRFVLATDEPADAGGPLVFTWLEQVVAAHLHRLFAGTEIIASYAFHVTRDSDIELDEDDGDDDEGSLMTVMRESIAQQAFGPVVRLKVHDSMPNEVRNWLVEHLAVAREDLYVVEGPLATHDFWELVALDRPDLKDPPFTPLPVPGLTEVPGQRPEDVFAFIRERDVLVHHPYQSFGAVVDVMQAAASDPNVVAIKQTLYRIGRDSPLIPSLIDARDDDTQVAVLVELRARFDEENNITWAEELERHGVHVAYGLAGLKTHCKATLFVRREPSGLRRYVHLATGNYNAGTARIYEDFGYFTAREEIGSDVSDLFNVLTGFAFQEDYHQLWVAPQNLRESFLRVIQREIAAHQRTGHGRLVFKVNALVDRVIIRALYKASQAGVKVDLIVRGACCLRPGVPGWSENIRVVSIVGRFLEHSRIYFFDNGGANEVYLGSADLMERNLDRRVEAVFPVEDTRWAAEIRDEIIPAYLRDTVNSWELGADGIYRRIEPTDSEQGFDVQAWLMNRYRVPPDWALSTPRAHGPQQVPLPATM